jgi:hypothetical protein
MHTTVEEHQSTAKPCEEGQQNLKPELSSTKQSPLQQAITKQQVHVDIADKKGLKLTVVICRL